MKCVFCLFAEDVNLLPNKLFKKLLDRAHKDPAKFKPLATQLFAAMNTGGEFGLDPIPFFNGGLFDDAKALDLNYSDIGLLLIAATQDWSAVEPHIFGTLFERALDLSKRAQIGAHHTIRDDIMSASPSCSPRSVAIGTPRGRSPRQPAAGPAAATRPPPHAE